MHEPTLLDLTLDELAEQLATLGCPRYRAEQIWRAAFVDLVSGYDAMSTLPRNLRTRLEAALPFTPCEVGQEQVSPDGATSKTLLRLADGETVEVVSMEYAGRATACVSSQIGCAIGCPFCATGQAGFVRNLSSGEIVAQTLHVARTLQSRGRRLSNVVYMGMGEPLANVDAVLRSIRLLNDPRGFGVSELREYRQRKDLIRGLFRFWQVAFFVAEEFVGLLQVDGELVMRAEADLVLFEMFLQLIAPRSAYDK